jgi:hypothetical protein
MAERKDLALPASSSTFAGSLPDDRDPSWIPGNYFKATVDIAPRIETFEHSDRFGGREGEKSEVTRQARRGVAAGTTLLAVKLHFLDDVLHSVVCAPHPEDHDRSHLAFMTDEFFSSFTSDQDAEEQREEAIERLLSEMRTIRKEIRTRPDIARPGLLPAPAHRRPTSTELVLHHNRSQDIVARMDTMIEAARELETEARDAVALLNSKNTLLQRYMSEKSDAILAATSDLIEFGNEVKKGVTTMSLYTGESDEGPTVDVQTIATGESAPPDAPLTLYQNLLYLDEELAVDLADQGFDFIGLDKLGNILASDGSLIERMIPAPRGAVLVRVRRDDKNYFIGDDSFAAALRNAQLNMENMVTYLLVRDGGNVHLVHSEVTSDLTKHLFPTKHEIDEIFRLHGRDIRPEHLEYSKVKNDFEARTLYYKRVLLMMWGLDHRLGLFGPFHGNGEYSGWYDDRFHAERIVYVHDVEGAIGEDRPSFADWIAQKNTMIQQGSRLIVDWRELITDASAPYCFEDQRDSHDRSIQRYVPMERFGTATVSVKEGRLVVKTAVRHKWHDEFGRKRRTFNATVDLLKGVSSYPPSAICLDDVTREEIRYYLNSRSQRRSYLSFLQLFRIMDDILKRDEEAQAAVLSRLGDSMVHSGVDGERAAWSLRSAIGMWKAANGVELVGGHSWKPRNENQILDIAYALAGERNGLFERAGREIPDCVPIDLRINGKGQIILYWEVPPSRREPFMDVFGDIFVLRSILKVRRDRIEIEGEPLLTYAHNPGFAPRRGDSDNPEFRHPIREVSLVCDRERLEAHVSRHLPDWIGPDQARHIHAICSFDAKKALQSLHEDVAEARIGHSVLNVVVYKGQVNEGLVVIPLGILELKDAVHVVAVESKGLDFLASSGEGSLHAAQRMAMKRYKDKEFNVKRLQGIADAADPARPTMRLFSTSNWERLEKGINFLDEDAVHGRVIMPRGGYHFRSGGTDFATILEAVKGEIQSDRREYVRLHFLSEGSRELAETYFEAARKKP